MLALRLRAAKKRPKIRFPVKNQSSVSEIARQTLRIEADALRELAEEIGEDFADCIHAIHATDGRIVVTGIGKTALVARKIVATLNSTGTPALFLHAADAIHGDIGMVQPGDVVLVLSRSGETAEITTLAQLVRHLGNLLVAMTARADSSLARSADFVLLTPFHQEADPNKLAPTTSTTLQMAMGDAIATSLLALRGFSPADFARLHPGGSLGKRLYLRVADLYPKNQRPLVSPATPLRDTLLEITAKCLGATAVVDPEERVLGIITDGDLRRLLSQAEVPDRLTAAELMTRQPKTIDPTAAAIQALNVMEEYSISQLLVVGADDRYLGVVHLHDLIREGLV